MYYCIFIKQISYYHVCASTFFTLWVMLLTMPALPLCGTILYLPSYSPYMSSLHNIYAFASVRSTHFSQKYQIICNICHLKKTRKSLLPSSLASYSSTESLKVVSDITHFNYSHLLKSIFRRLSSVDNHSKVLWAGHSEQYVATEISFRVC